MLKLTKMNCIITIAFLIHVSDIKQVVSAVLHENVLNIIAIHDINFTGSECMNNHIQLATW